MTAFTSLTLHIVENWVTYSEISEILLLTKDWYSEYGRESKSGICYSTEGLVSLVNSASNDTKLGFRLTHECVLNWKKSQICSSGCHPQMALPLCLFPLISVTRLSLLNLKLFPNLSFLKLSKISFSHWCWICKST